MLLVMLLKIRWTADDVADALAIHAHAKKSPHATASTPRNGGKKKKRMKMVKNKHDHPVSAW